MSAATEDAKFFAATAKCIADQLVFGEDALRLLAPRQEEEAAAQRPVAEAVQLLRRLLTRLSRTFTQLQLANMYGSQQALRIAGPHTKIRGLSDEEMKILREVQKEGEAQISAGKMAAAKLAAKVAPYPAPGAGGPAADRKAASACHTCGVTGHWARDNRCKPADIHAKAMRDAAAKMQLAAMPSLPAAPGFGYGLGGGPHLNYMAAYGQMGAGALGQYGMQYPAAMAVQPAGLQQQAAQQLGQPAGAAAAAASAGQLQIGYGGAPPAAGN
jgi:hypothetical protein